MKNRKPRIFSHLLAIPIVLVVDVIVLSVASIAEQKMVGQDGLPLSLMALMVVTIVTVFVSLRAILSTIQALIRNWKNSQEKRED